MKPQPLRPMENLNPSMKGQPRTIFSKKEIHSAVEWLKNSLIEQMKSDGDVSMYEIRKLIDEAFGEVLE